MRTLAILISVAACAGVPAAADGGGPPQYASQGGLGVSAANGSMHYVAVPGNGTTMVEAIRRDGSVWNWPAFAGSWGIPMITYRDAGGLSRDGLTLALQSVAVGRETSFLLMGTRSFRKLDGFTLKGNFSFDAWSPDSSKLYLIQRVDSTNYSRYVVRAYDLRAHTLLPGRIADRTQKSWVMQGDAVTRTTSSSGRWVYTLYMNQGGTPFIHALDTVRGVAHCIGIPWASTDQSALGNVALTLHGRQLAVHWRTGKRWLDVNTATWRVSPAAGSPFPWRWLGLGAGVLAAPAILLLLARRRRIHLSDGTLLARAA